MSDLQIERLTTLGIALAVTVGCWLLGLLVRRFVRPLLQGLAHRTATDIDDMVLDSIRPHVPFWFLMLGMVIAARVAGARPVALGWVDRTAGVLLIVSVSMALASFAVRWISRSGPGDEAGRRTTSLTENMVRWAIVSIGLMVALNTAGISITPILTALGVGSLAVALAIQPTLTNLFAGMQISLNGRVRVGDFIELEAGQSGNVTDITWRSTQILEVSGNTIVVPNAKLVDAIVRNYHLPTPEMGFGVPVSVGYDSDLDRVERVILEEARAVMTTVPGAAPGFEPLARVTSFGADGVHFNVILRGASPPDRFVLIHHLLKRLHARFEAEGIDIPYPQRVVHVQRGEDANAVTD